MRRILILAVGSLSIFPACSRPDRNTEAIAAGAGQPVQGDWAVIRYESEPDTLNPLINQSTAAQYAISGVNNSQIYEFLLKYDTKDWGLTEPLLAESYPAVSDDRLTYTFTIRDGIKWHDGQPLTSADVFFTFLAAMCPLVDSAPARSYFTELADIQVEGRNVRFTMSKASVYNIKNISNTIPVIPKHVFDPEGLLDGLTFKDIIGPKGRTDPKIRKFADQFNKHPNNRAPVGTGPYKFEKWETGREPILARKGQ